MKFKLKHLFVAKTVIIFTLVATFTVSALPLSLYPTDENTGWAILPSEIHMGNKSTTFRYQNSDVKTKYEDIVNDGISFWGNHIDMTYSENSNEGIIVVSSEIFDENSTAYSAAAERNTWDTDKHALSWTITIYKNYFDNVDETYKPIIIAHEIGHIYGLAHVSNTSQIMCNKSLLRAVTLNDIRGMKVMTHEHIHSDSSFNYTYDGFMHTKRCGYCYSGCTDYCTYTSEHVGNMHYYYFNCICGNNEVLSWLCSGNPCIMPYSVVNNQTE